MAKIGFPQAQNDFHKSNGADTVTMPVGASMTRQEFAEECDINTLMKKYEGHGTGPGNLMFHGDPSMWYADFTTLPANLMEYHEYMDAAQASFMRLNANVRKQFENDPVQFVEFASDPANVKQMREWGLAEPEPSPKEPLEVRVVEPDPPAAAAPGGSGKPVKA